VLSCGNVVSPFPLHPSSHALLIPQKIALKQQKTTLFKPIPRETILAKYLKIPLTV
jgi:hypothetical protein